MHDRPMINPRKERYHILTAIRHVDGHDYMYALSEMLDGAKECIFILVSPFILSYHAVVGHILKLICLGLVAHT